MNPFRDEGGHWVVPSVSEVAEGVTGFGWIRLTPEHPQYAEWVAYLGDWVQGTTPGGTE